MQGIERIQMHAQIHCAYQSFQDTYFTTSRVGRKLHKIVELGTLAETEDTYDAGSRLFWPSATANLIFLRVSGLTELTGEFRHFYSIMYVMKQFRPSLHYFYSLILRCYVNLGH